MEIHKTIIRTTACILCFLALSVPAKAYLNPSIKERPQAVTIHSESPFLAQIVKTNKIEKQEVKRVEEKNKKANQAIRLSDQELISVLKKAGFSGNGLKMAWAIVQKESTARPFAHNDNPSTGDNSYGLFQINMRGDMGPSRRDKYGLSSNDELFDPMTNAKIAFKMSNGGKAWGPWTTQKKALEILSQFPG
jgi:hypothetical protein